jgi:hypothetical protein
MARMGSGHDTLGVVIVDHHLDELVHLHPEGRVIEIETPRWAGSLLLVEVRTDEGQRLDCWDARAGTVSWSVEEPGSWCLVGRERIAAAGGLLDLRTGERLLELPEHHEPSEPGPAAKSAASRAAETPRTLDLRQRVASEAGEYEVYACGPHFVTQRDAVAVLHDERGVALSEHGVPAPGAHLASDGSWSLPSDPASRWDSLGRPTSEPTGAVVAAAARGPWLASLDSRGVLIVRDRAGEVAVRGSLGDTDWDWAEHGEISLAWLDDRQLAVCVGPALRVLDVHSGAWSRQAPSELVSVCPWQGGVVTAHRWGAVRGWDAAGSLVFEVTTRGGLRRAVVSGERLLIAADEEWQLLDLAGEVLASGPLESPDRELRIALSPRAGWVAVCSGAVRLYDAQGELEHEVGDYSARGVAFLSEEVLLAAVGGELLWVRCATGEVDRRVRAHRGWISALQLGDRPLTGSEDGMLLWD